MAVIETYEDEEQAIGARDDYNHNQEGKRAVAFSMPATSVEDYGGGSGENVFKEEITPETWMVVIEDI